jgi:hypothetical protein
VRRRAFGHFEVWLADVLARRARSSSAEDAIIYERASDRRGGCCIDGIEECYSHIMKWSMRGEGERALGTCVLAGLGKTSRFATTKAFHHQSGTRKSIRNLSGFHYRT